MHIYHYERTHQHHDANLVYITMTPIMRWARDEYYLIKLNIVYCHTNISRSACIYQSKATINRKLCIKKYKNK